MAMARTSQVNGLACGLGACDAWARDLPRDECFPAEDTEPLTRVAWSSGEVALGFVDARAAAMQYLSDGREHVGAAAAEHLEVAAELLQKEWDAVMSRHDHMPWGGETGPHLIEVTTRENREALPRGVLEAKDHYGRAIEHTERGSLMEQTDDRLETDRLVIRRFTKDDWAEIQKLAIDMGSSEAATYDHAWPTSEEGCRGAAEYLSKNGCYWAVCPKDSDRIIGLVSFNNIEDDGRLDFGHLFHRDFALNDLDTEAIACAVDHAFAVLDIDAIVCRNALDWTVQLAPLKSLGFWMKGQGKGSFRKDENGDPIEFRSCQMEMTRDVWLQRGRPHEPTPDQ